MRNGIKNLKFILAMIILASLGLVGGMVWRNMAPSEQSSAPRKPASDPADLKLDRLIYTETKEGKKEWELEAASASYFKDKGTVVLNKVKATFFGKNQETYVLVSEKGMLNTVTKAIEVYEGVKIDTSDGYQVRTASLKYLAESRELSTPDRVVLSGPQMQVEGVGLVLDLDKQRVRILDQVQTTLSHFGFRLSTRGAAR
jgi:LPS export ABC transporter protein LptC